MKTNLLKFILAVLTLGLLGSCSEINERIDGLDNRVTILENSRIASIDNQIAAINSSIADLGAIRNNTQDLISKTQAQGGDITGLKAADIALGQRIDELKRFVGDTLSLYAKTEWVNATFATLKQHEWTCDTIAGIDARIGALDTKLSLSISGLEGSLKQWVNEQLDYYYTAAQMDVKIGALLAKIQSTGSSANARIDSLAAELTATKSSVDTAKANIRSEYRSVIASAIETSEGKLTQALKDSITAVNGKITALTGRIDALETTVAALSGDVDALKAMIQSVSITPAYSDGSVEAVGGILTLKCIVKPAKALSGIESLKDSLLIYADSVKVKTKASAYMVIKASEAEITDSVQGAISLKANISECLPKGAGKALTVALNVKNGLSDFTTEFVVVAVKTFKAVYDTNGGANTLTFYYDANDHSGEGITVYDNLPSGATAYTSWGYNGILGNIKSVKIDPSVEGYKGLTSTAYMFFNMTEAVSISGAEYLDVSNVKNMAYMFCAYGRNPTSLTAVPDVSGWKTDNVEKMGNLFASYGQNSTSLTAPPDVSKWNTGNVTDMGSMFSGYGQNSTSLTAVPDVSGWKTDNVTKMGTLFAKYGDANKNNINCVLDLTGWNLANLAPNNNVFYNFSPNTFKVTIPAKTGENANLPEKWYGSGTSYFAPPAGKTFTPLEYVEIGGVKWATKNLGAEKVTDYGDYFAWGETAPYYEGTGGWPATPTWKSGKASGYAWQSYCGSSSFSEWSTPPYDATTKILKPEFDAAAQILGNGWRMPTFAEFQALYDACLNGSYDTTTNPSGASASVGKGVYWCTNYDGVAGCLFCDGTNKLFFPAAGYGSNTTLLSENRAGCYCSSDLNKTNNQSVDAVNFNKSRFNIANYSRSYGFSIRPVTE